MDKIEANNQYIAVLLIEILFESGFVNRATYFNVKKRLNLHNSQEGFAFVQYS